MMMDRGTPTPQAWTVRHILTRRTSNEGADPLPFPFQNLQHSLLGSDVRTASKVIENEMPI